MNIYELEKQATHGRAYRDHEGFIATTDGARVADMDCNDRDIDEREANKCLWIHCRNNFMNALEGLTRLGDMYSALMDDHVAAGRLEWVNDLIKELAEVAE